MDIQDDKESNGAAGLADSEIDNEDQGCQTTDGKRSEGALEVLEGDVEAGPAKENDSGPATDEEEPQETTAEGGDPEEDVVAEEEASEDPLEKMTKDKEALEDNLLRLRADFENYKKRVARDRKELIQHGNEALLKDLLPTVDNVERILTYGPQEGNWKSFQEGIELVLSEIHKTFSQYGVQPIEALDKEFDPGLHEAMQRLETDDTPADTVVEVFQKGYTFRDRLLRPSLVSVAAPLPKKEEPEEGERVAEESTVEAGEEAEGEKKIIN